MKQEKLCSLAIENFINKNLPENRLSNFVPKFIRFIFKNRKQLKQKRPDINLRSVIKLSRKAVS